MDVVVAVNVGDRAQDVLQAALPWARRMNAKVHLRAVSAILWVADDVFGGGDHYALAQEWQRRRRREETELKELAATIPADLAGTPALLHGDAAQRLIEASKEMDAVLLGTHGRVGFAHLFLGSVAERVLREAHSPVVVLPHDAAPIPEHGPVRVLLPIDAMSPSFAAATTVQDWLGPSAELHLVYALADVRVSQELGRTPPIDRAELHPHAGWAHQQLSQAQREAGIDASLHLILSEGAHPAPSLAQFARQLGVHVMAMPTHGRTGLERLAYGSVTERAVRWASCASLVVR